MKKTGLLLTFLLILSAGSYAQTRYWDCRDILFLNDDDLHSYGSSQKHPCIFDYQGESRQLPWGWTNHCTGWAFRFLNAQSYITMGPLLATTTMNFDYDNTTARVVTIWTSATPTANWTILESFSPGLATCGVRKTITIQKNYYWRVTATFPAGGNSHEFAIRNIFPTDDSPVELIGFRASRTGDGVKLQWRTATETNSRGFEVQRSASENEWETIGFVEGHGTSSVAQNYFYLDTPPASKSDVSYRLKEIDRDGSFQYSPVVSVSAWKATALSFEGAYPNPFNPTTTLRFSVPQDSRVTLKVFDVAGQLVETVVGGEYMRAGTYSYMFAPRSISSGEYFAWLANESGSTVLKLHLTK